MSIADTNRMLALEARVAALEEMVANNRAFPSRRPPSAPVNDTVMADVIGALQAGQSIRGAARMLGLDRSKVARLRQRAIDEGRLTVSPG